MLQLQAASINSDNWTTYVTFNVDTSAFMIN